MTRCGLCAEEIQDSAIVCRFCGAERTAQGWARPVTAAPATTAPVTNGYAVASLVLGIVWVYWIGSILALIFGYKARSDIDRSGGTQSGRGMAIAGIVLGWIGVATLTLIILLAFGTAATGW